jgi:hypothetical protein
MKQSTGYNLINFESGYLHYSSIVNLLIKNKNQWSIGNDGQRHTFTNLVEKLIKLRCEAGPSGIC